MSFAVPVGVLLSLVLVPAPAALAAVPPGPVSLDGPANQVVDGTIAPALTLAYQQAGLGGSLRPNVRYNDNGTLTVYSDPTVGPDEDLLTSPFVADPEVRINTPAPGDAADVAVTDGVGSWKLVVGTAAPQGTLAAARLDLVETAPGGPLGNHTVSVCAAQAASLLLGCLLDSDRDDYSTHQELLAGSDPTDPGSVPGHHLVENRIAAIQAFSCARAAATSSTAPCPFPLVEAS